LWSTFELTHIFNALIIFYLTFMWITAHERLVTNYQRGKWRGGISPTCSVLEWRRNKHIHILRDCIHATQSILFSLVGSSPEKDDWVVLPVKFGSCDAFHAKMWGMYIRMDLIKKHGIIHLQVESDSKVLVVMVTWKYNVKRIFLCILNRRICDLTNMKWYVQINHTWHEENKPADKLANYSITNIKLFWFACFGATS
jgi:hypothetical protein